MFSKETLQIVRRLQQARLSLMQKQPFYAVLLLHIQFSLDPMCETAYTDGERIAFGPEFIESLSDAELEFVLMHEVLHAALNHCNRSLDTYDFDDFNAACDIVVNSNILYSCSMDLAAITLRDYGVSMHLAPDGSEGFGHTVEEVYRMIQEQKAIAAKPNLCSGSGKSGSGKSSGDGDSEEFEDGEQSENSEESEGEEKSENGKEAEDGEESEDGEKSEDGDKTEQSGKPGSGAQQSARRDGGFDDHTYWGLDDSGAESEETGGNETDAGQGADYNQDDLKNVWMQRMIEATTIANQIISIKESREGYGGAPLMAQRLLKSLTQPQTDWREILQDFVQEEVNDYSFSPPDRRFQDSPFLLPDYNEKDERIRGIWFLIDTSGSISDDAIRAAYSEICSAIELFDGKLEGRLSFTESYVTEPVPFESVDDLLAIRPVGGGGNDFSAIFRYMNEKMQDEKPSYIIIITDGYDAYPDESEACGIPVLWLINNENSNPPWGKIARITVN